jgi:predicted nucleic-acid-binding protein
MITFREKNYSDMNKSNIKEIVEKLEKERIEDFEVREYISDNDISINTDLDNLEIYIPKEADFARYDIEDFISDMLPYSSINTVMERKVYVLKVRGKLRKDQYYKLIKFIIEEEGYVVIKSPEYIN